MFIFINSKKNHCQSVCYCSCKEDLCNLQFTNCKSVLMFIFINNNKNLTRVFAIAPAKRTCATWTTPSRARILVSGGWAGWEQNIALNWLQLQNLNWPTTNYWSILFSQGGALLRPWPLLSTLLPLLLIKVTDHKSLKYNSAQRKITLKKSFRLFTKNHAKETFQAGQQGHHHLPSIQNFKLP